MKRLLSLLMALVMVLSLLPLAAFADDTPTITATANKTEAAIGDTVEVTFTLANNPGFNQADMTLTFDKNVLQFTGLKTIKVGVVNITDGNFAAGSTEINTKADNEKYGNIQYASGEVLSEDGSLFTALFTVIGAGNTTVGVTVNSLKAVADNGSTINHASTVVTAASSGITIADNPTTYTISIAEGIVGGTVTAAPTTAVAGATIILSNVPANGYTFGFYSVVDADGDTVPVAADGTFTMPASNVTVSATFTANQPTEPAVKGYSVSLQCADPEIIAAYGDTPEKAAVTVGVSNTEEEIDTYNAYNLFLTYPEGLSLESYTGSGVQDDNFEIEHDATARTIQVIGYGANKTLDQSPVTLYFSGAKVGNYDVTLTEAYMDIAGNANAADAPKATIQTDAVTVKVTGYKVTLGTGLSAESEVAVPGQDFTFRATDYSTHDYVVTAMIGDAKIDVTDNKDGTYTIDGEDITGNINITATMNPKSYDVTINGEAAAQATYSEDYTFNAAKAGYTIQSVTAKIGETTLTTTNDGEGNYTIAGTDITGEITITIEWEEITPETVTVNSTGAEGFSGPGSATKGQPYTFSFAEPDKYEYTGLKVVVGEGENARDITDKLIKNADGSFTIPAEYVTGPITITVTRTKKNPTTVEVAEYVKLSESQSIWLVTASGVPEGSIAKYNGLNMYWSAKNQVTTVDENGEQTQTNGPGYGAYAYLVIAGRSEQTVLEDAMSKVTVVDQGQETIVTVNYSGDVNCSGKPDINDAQLVYNMYNAHYESFDESAGGASMLKFLNADLNGDKGLDTQDALVVVNTILANT